MRTFMKSTRLAISAVMFGAAVLWAAGRVAVAQDTDALDPSVGAYKPSPLVQVTAPRGAADSGLPEEDLSDHSDDPALRGSVPLSPDAVDVITNGRRYWYDDGLWYVEEGSGLSPVQPPVGIVISKLPPMYAIGFLDDGTPDYIAHGVHYVAVENGYAVTDPPVSQH